MEVRTGKKLVLPGSAVSPGNRRFFERVASVPFTIVAKRVWPGYSFLHE